jgi:hypothetical protein
MFVFGCAEKFQITFRLRRKRIVLRAVEDVTGRTQNQLSFKVGDKIMLLEKPKVGRWWKGMHNGQTGYFQANHVEDTGQPPEFTLEDESLVPCLLTPEPPPGLLEKEWPLADETAPLQIGRVWRFSFLPLPFFPQVIVRLLHSGESRFVPAHHHHHHHHHHHLHRHHHQICCGSPHARAAQVALEAWHGGGEHSR